MIFRYDTVQEMRASCSKLSRELQPMSSILNHNPRGCRWNGWHRLDRRHSRRCNVSSKSVSKLHTLGRVRFHLGTSYLGGQHRTLITTSKHCELKVLAFVKFAPQGKYHKCCGSLTTPRHTQMCASLRPSWNWMAHVAASTLQSWHRTTTL
jgi:hypothetical protein